ncbi:MAG: hypothetical protein NPIRA01_21090 [Nitrospirales bacterium]|nr:MAG: hypothetical protein NPIRA01_21090 [Nitrospirales bacterium]
MSIEAKWKANQDKAAYLKKFPGLLSSWEQTVGQTVEHVVPLTSDTGTAMIVFSNATFAVSPPVTIEPRDLKAGLSAGRAILEAKLPEAFAEYDRLALLDQEAGRKARMENILGAITNNLEQIPELKDHIRTLVQTWDS